MEFIRPDINLDFIGRRKIAFTLSLALIAITILSLILHGGPKYGIDFAGGTIIQIKVPEGTTPPDIRNALEPVGMGGAMIQRFGPAAHNEFLIRTDINSEEAGDVSAKVRDALNTGIHKEAEVRRVESVGPQVGQDLREKAMLAMLYALLFITIYISGRFELKWIPSAIMAGITVGVVYLLSLFTSGIAILMIVALVVSLLCFWFLDLPYAMGAIAALIHDVCITVGVFSLMGKEFSLPIMAALLTIVGYSLNDTIIVFDRIRENLTRYQKKPLDIIINRSVNETLSRTILTSGTTLVVVLSLFLFGGEIIHDFAFALLAGVIVGTYSSIFVASPILLTWQAKRPRKV